MAPIDELEVKNLELKLNSALPDSYKYLLTTYGLVHTPNVLTKICDLNVAITEVQDFLSVEDVASLSQLYELSGMPVGHIVFASDCKGNMFCFKKEECGTHSEDSPVWFYEHGTTSVTCISASFSEWLDEFNNLEDK